MNNQIQKILIFISLISIWGSLIYYIYSLNNIGFFVSLVATIYSYSIIDQKILSNNSTPTKLILTFFKDPIIYYFKKIKSLPYLTILLLFIYLFIVIFTNKISSSIISVWDILPNQFFLIFIIITIITVIYTRKKTQISLLVLIYLFCFSINALVYKINYGFDPFIHEAAVSTILKNGQIDPKSPYYIGAYALEIFIFKLSPFSLNFINKSLVPILAAFFIPISLLKLTNLLNLSKHNLIILALLSLPFSYFTFTTPQSLAYLYLILLIIYSLIHQATNKKKDLLTAYLLSFATILTHPIAGVPALLFVILLYNKATKDKKIVSYASYLLLLISLPTLFYLNNSATPLSINVSAALQNLKNTFTSINFPYKEGPILNFVYFFSSIIPWLIVLLAIFGITISKQKKYNIPKLYLNFSIILFGSYLLVSSLDFSFLINYERSNYASRILLISSFFLLPYLLLAITRIINKIFKEDLFIKLTFILFLAMLVTASLYISYPRRDNYHNSRGYSTSQYDIDAVNWIYKNSKGKDFIVLANQQVSAASLHEYGFYKYYKINNKEQLFYYPIPTGGKLYEYYLDMVYKEPSKTTIKKAMTLANVNLGYFVLNKYWWAFDKIANEAKLEADFYKTFGNNDVIVFKYKKTPLY